MTDDTSERERQALHEVEIGLEWVHRAHGHLVSFHHAVGHAMDHFAAAEEQLADCGFEELAAEIRDDLLPRGVIDETTWSYDVLERFQDGLLADVEAFENSAREQISGGVRHVAERAQERAWKDRSQRDRSPRD